MLRSAGSQRLPKGVQMGALQSPLALLQVAGQTSASVQAEPSGTHCSEASPVQRRAPGEQMEGRQRPLSQTACAPQAAEERAVPLELQVSKVAVSPQVVEKGVQICGLHAPVAGSQPVAQSWTKAQDSPEGVHC